MSDSTVFDSVFKTLVHKEPRLMIPFINETFGRSYAKDALIVRFGEEHETPSGSRATDSVFRLEDKLYHIECQSTPDASMVIRMIEYDFAIALEEAWSKGRPYEMNFPSSCVLFLRHDKNTPETLKVKVNLPDGTSFDYYTKVVKAQTFTSDDIFNKDLLVLLPFYLMRYETLLAQIEADKNRTAQLIEECVDLNRRLAETALANQDRLLYEELIELIIRVSDYLLEAHKNLQGKVRAAMGGEVLELLNDRAKRLEKEAEQRGLAKGFERGHEEGLEQGLAQGREQGLEQGIEQGREQGREQAIDRFSRELQELGVSADIIRRSIEAVRKPSKSNS